jgi:hypothetical protein
MIRLATGEITKTFRRGFLDMTHIKTKTVGSRSSTPNKMGESPRFLHLGYFDCLFFFGDVMKLCIWVVVLSYIENNHVGGKDREDTQVVDCCLFIKNVIMASR